MSVPWKKIRKEIETTSDKYLVCVSGGVDSIFLLDFMIKSNVYIEIAHFNHNIREDSYEDFNLIRQYALDYKCPFWYNESSSLNKDSNEVDARNERWNFIEDIAKERGFTHIVTAHHADDQVENVLIRLMRGDPHNILAMKKLVDMNGLTRYKPFLDIPKEVIVKQAKYLGLTWNEDSTNMSDKYDRNFVRNTLLPMMATRTNVYKSILTGISKTI